MSSRLVTAVFGRPSSMDGQPRHSLLMSNKIMYQIRTTLPQGRHKNGMIPQSVLNIEKKERSNPLKWKGQFSPQLVSALLSHHADSSSIVFDPFLGSGTVLLESGLLNLTATGTEINPAATKLAKLYELINVQRDIRNKMIKQVQQLLEDHLPFSDKRTLFSQSEDSIEPLEKKLLAIHQKCDEKLMLIVLDTLIVLSDFQSPFELNTTQIHKTWHKLKQLIHELPYASSSVKIFHADARCSPLQNDTVDLVVTSPPYINVFNYHQQYRKSAEALNWNLLQVAKSEFGANRKHRANRFFTVTQYCLDMAQTFMELKRVCKHDARLIFVVGKQSNVNKTPFFNGKIIAELANSYGFDLIVEQQRCFRNTFGTMIYEDILHLTPSQQLSQPELDTARTVAHAALIDALKRVPQSSKERLHCAIDDVSRIEPSPYFNVNECHYV